MLTLFGGWISSVEMDDFGRLRTVYRMSHHLKKRPIRMIREDNHILTNNMTLKDSKEFKKK